MAELIDRKPIIKRVKRFAEYEWNGSRKQAYMEFLDMLTDAPTTTEAEIRAKAEHTYENCHNITCRRKCQKDGYNMAIDEFARKLLINFNDWQMSVAEVGNEKEYETIGNAIIGIEEIAERLKERD